MKTKMISAGVFASGMLLITLSIALMVGHGSVSYAQAPQRMPQAAETPTPPAPTAIPATVIAPTVPPASNMYGDPYVVKTVNAAQAKPGETIEFVLMVGNKGNADAVNVQVRDTLANHLDIVSVTSTKGNVSIDVRKILVDIGTVGVKEVITIKITARGNNTMQSGSCENLAVLNTTSGGDRADNNMSGVNYLCGEVVSPVTGSNSDHLKQAIAAWAILVAGAFMLAIGAHMKPTEDV